MNKLLTIENYVNQLEQGELTFATTTDIDAEKTGQSKNYFKRLYFFFKCFIDFNLLHFKIFLNKNNSPKNIVFISPNLCFFKNNQFTIPLLEPINLKNNWYISHSKERYISKINNQKVYNLGGVVQVFNYFKFKGETAKSKTVYLHKWINDSFLKKFKNVTVYTLCYYDNNGLSLVFSDYRKNFILTEVQHGSMINFYPYQKPANFPVVDTFFVRNEATVNFLKANLAKNYNANYHLIPYPETNLFFHEGTSILYASSIETNGFHPVFLEFLKNNKISNLNIIVRLHPRELDKKSIFENQLKNLKIKYRFDESKNWLLANQIKNLIIVSPWSSVIEEGIDNGFTTIIIDEMGLKRYEDYIDNNLCFYSKDINLLFDK